MPGQNSIEISLLYGNGDSIKSWKVELTSAGTVRKTWTGDSKYLPKNDTGVMSPEGTRPPSRSTHTRPWLTWTPGPWMCWMPQEGW
jgi:hypothetical protein